MLRLDDFTANVAKSGLVPPEVVDLGPGRSSIRLPADDAAVRLARRLIQERLAHHLPGPEAPLGRDPRLLPGRLSAPPPPGRRGHGQGLPGRRRPTASRSPSRCSRPARPSRKRTPCSGSAARWTSPGAVRTPTSPARSSVGNEGDVHFMVMEYIPGESLFEMVKSDAGRPAPRPRRGPAVPQADRRPRRRPPRRADPSRHQAVEHHDHARRRREAARPGPGPAPWTTRQG